MLIQITFKKTEDANYDQTKEKGKRRDNECFLNELRWRKCPDKFHF